MRKPPNIDLWLSLAYTHKHTCTCMHTRKHTHIHTGMHTHTHAYTQAHICTHSWIEKNVQLSQSTPIEFPSSSSVGFFLYSLTMETFMGPVVPL